MQQEIGLFYGSTTGNTDDVANLIVENIGHEKVVLHDIAAGGLSAVDQYQTLIFGIPTWDFGELQEDWQDLWPELEQMDFTGRQCALFGLGDQIGYGEWFLDAMGLLHDLLKEKGAELVGYWPADDSYSFEASKALTDDEKFFVGLAVDEDTQHGETDERVERWCQQIKLELGVE